MTKLTPEILVKYGFVYHPCGISGADMWQGMDFWRKTGNTAFTLRGNCSSTGRNSLKLIGYFNSRIEYLEELNFLHRILYGEHLTPL